MPHPGDPYSSQIAVQTYAPMGARREFLPEEQAAIDAGESRWLPRIFQNYGTPIPEMMASPGKTGLLTGLATGALGAGLGGMVGASYGNSTPAAIAGAALGGLGAGGAGALFGYHDQKSRNEGLEDIMRRLPPGSTKRDYLADSVVQREMDRALEYSQVENQAAMQRALVRSMLMKQSSDAGFPGEMPFQDTLHPDAHQAVPTSPPRLPATVTQPHESPYLSPEANQLLSGAVSPEAGALLGMRPGTTAPPLAPPPSAVLGNSWMDWAWRNKLPIGLGALGLYGLYHYMTQPSDEDERERRHFKEAGIGGALGGAMKAVRRGIGRYPRIMGGTAATVGLGAGLSTQMDGAMPGDPFHAAGTWGGNLYAGENLDARTEPAPKFEPPPGPGLAESLDTTITNNLPNSWQPYYDKLKGYGQQGLNFVQNHPWEVGGGLLSALALASLIHRHNKKDDEDDYPYKRASTNTEPVPVADLAERFPEQVGFLAACYDKGMTPRAIRATIEKAASQSKEASQAWADFFLGQLEPRAVRACT